MNINISPGTTRSKMPAYQSDAAVNCQPIIFPREIYIQRKWIYIYIYREIPDLRYMTEWNMLLPEEEGLLLKREVQHKQGDGYLTESRDWGWWGVTGGEGRTGFTFTEQTLTSCQRCIRSLFQTCCVHFVGKVVISSIRSLQRHLWLPRHYFHLYLKGQRFGFAQSREVPCAIPKRRISRHSVGSRC